MRPWHRLLEWTNGSAQAERLVGQILAQEGFIAIDPSHPLGGPDGLRDAVCQRDGKSFVVACYFPRGRKSQSGLKAKFKADIPGVRRHKADGFVFMTNQEISLAVRRELRKLAEHNTHVELYHLERITLILDTPAMTPVREQFLGIGATQTAQVNLGGLGGSAPGAGGGGGGVVGIGAAGAGGDGGATYVRLDGSPASAPGAGGGGGGSQVVGGDGGNGGEANSAIIAVEPGKTYEIRIGEGGQLGSSGKRGGDGGDTSFGDIPVARGGKGGSAGQSRPRRLTDADIKAGTCVTSLFCAESVNVHNGRFYVLGGAWDHYCLNNIPDTFSCATVITIDFAPSTPCGHIEFEVTMNDPEGGQQALEHAVAFVQPDRPVLRSTFLVTLKANVTTPGVWSIVVQSGRQLATHRIELRQA